MFSISKAQTGHGLEARQQAEYDEWLRERNRIKARRGSLEKVDVSAASKATSASGMGDTNDSHDGDGKLESDAVDNEALSGHLARRASESESMMLDVLGVADVELIADGGNVNGDGDGDGDGMRPQCEETKLAIGDDDSALKNDPSDAMV